MSTTLEMDGLVPFPNYAGKKVCLGLSGGINSAAVLCFLATAPNDLKAAELHLMTHQFAEHSDDTPAFIEACRAYAHAHFPCVVVAETDNSVLAYFEASKMIPHPSLASCTKHLKILPMLAYMVRHGITDNPVGYVSSERRRVNNMAKHGEITPGGVRLASGIEAQFPIRHFSDAWCFELVKREIGWYPAIYDIRDERGRQVFAHNNCLPCKNMNVRQLADVARHFPQKMAAARLTEEVVGRHWGRDEAAYYAQFGKHADPQQSGVPCGVCALD